MNWEIAGAIGDLVGGLAVVITLIYLSMQIKKSQSAAIANALEQTQSIRIALENQILDHAETWTKANAGDNLTLIEKTIIDSILRARAVQASLSYYRAVRLGQSKEPMVLNYAKFLHQNPVARTWWLKDQNEQTRLIQDFSKASNVFDLQEHWQSQIKQMLESWDKLDVNKENS